MNVVFHDRREAGRALATRLLAYRGRPGLLVLALPRGGVPVAFEVARALAAPLDVFVVRKLGVPGYPELAMGAIASGGVRVLNHEVVQAVGIRADDIDRVAVREEQELRRREAAYRNGSGPLDVTARTVIVVDDGLATGATVRAAILALRQLGAAFIAVAVPTAALDTCTALEREADDVVCATTPTPFDAVGMWYRDFSQMDDAEVKGLLAESRASHADDPRGDRPRGSRTGGQT